MVGAGGLGCELLKDLALTGIGHIDVIDMDTIDISNLNRQFLFRPEDVGKSKAQVAAARIQQRIPGVTVTPHHCMIQDKPIDFYEQFHIIVLGLDSLEARRYMNSVACSFLQYTTDDSGTSTPTPSSIKPLIDGGTEGFKGHARVLYPGLTPCFECTLWLFPPQTKYPLCTIAETPRSAPHCIEYAKIVLWPRERPDEEFDADNEEHMTWMFEKAVARATEFGIHGVTYQLTQGVVKNIIPAIASTNALIAAACSLEVLKTATNCSKGLENYLMYVGTDGIYTLTSQYERDPSCPVCSPGVGITVDRGATLEEVIGVMMRGREEGGLGGHLTAPSVSYGTNNLFMRGAMEGVTRPNLSRKIVDLIGIDGSGSGSGMEEGGEVVLTVNDRALVAPLRVRLTFRQHAAATTNDNAAATTTENGGSMM